MAEFHPKRHVHATRNLRGLLRHKRLGFQKTPGDLPGHPTKQMAQTHMGVSLNGGTPKTPQNDNFLVGKPMVPPF